MKSLNSTQFRNEATDFLNKVFKELGNVELDIQNWPVDHLCYRVSSVTSYEDRKKDFSLFSTLLVESEVNGRLISTFKLNDPIVYKNRVISLVELPSPKRGSSYEDGFEHIEVITPMGFKSLMSKFKDIDFDLSSLNKDLNPEVKVKFDSCQVKFHHCSLESIINLESNKEVFKMLQSSNIFEKLKDYSPIIAGTFPLGIHNNHSDMDILLQASSLKDFQSIVKQLFLIEEEFKEEFKEEFVHINGLDTYIINFLLDGIPIELFIQDKDPVTQVAYRHFLIEEQLLNVGGSRLKERIHFYRNRGMKTEPAFAKALNMTNKDSFNGLLELEGKSDIELKKIVDLSFN